MRKEVEVLDVRYVVLERSSVWGKLIPPGLSSAPSVRSGDIG